MMKKVQILEIKRDEQNLRFDRWVGQHFPELPHGKLQKLLRSGQFRVDGRRIKANTRVHEGQKVRVPPFELDKPENNTRPPITNEQRCAFRARLDDMIIHEDDDVIVINKPPGMAVQGGTKTTWHIDRLLDAVEKDGERPRLVHRLDRDTSGILILAKDRLTARDLTFAFQSHKARKLYWAIVMNVPDRLEGVIDMALSKTGAQGHQRMRPAKGEGKNARTVYHVLERSSRVASWLSLIPITGRTHQLRAHCAAMGTPILGDYKYGGAETKAGNAPKGLMLHAREILIGLPNGRQIRAKAEPPASFNEGLRWLGFDDSKPRFAVLDDWLCEKKFTDQCSMI